MHVDGFRFDLASALARELHEVDRLGAFFDILRQDPVLQSRQADRGARDLGEGGYQVGNFPPGWAEWNDKYRDTMRAYWRGDGGRSASSPAHDGIVGRLRGKRSRSSGKHQLRHGAQGFTLRDLVSYETKHNEANLEDNRDGSDNNISWNCGVEGPTDDPRSCGMSGRVNRATCSRRCSCRRGCP
jgi:glycogen operon protein